MQNRGRGSDSHTLHHTWALVIPAGIERALFILEYMDITEYKNILIAKIGSNSIANQNAFKNNMDEIIRIAVNMKSSDISEWNDLDMIEIEKQFSIALRLFSYIKQNYSIINELKQDSQNGNK